LCHINVTSTPRILNDMFNLYKSQITREVKNNVVKTANNTLWNKLQTYCVLPGNFSRLHMKHTQHARMYNPKTQNWSIVMKSTCFRQNVCTKYGKLVRKVGSMNLWIHYSDANMITRWERKRKFRIRKTFSVYCSRLARLERWINGTSQSHTQCHNYPWRTISCGVLYAILFYKYTAI